MRLVVQRRLVGNSLRIQTLSDAILYLKVTIDLQLLTKLFRHVKVERLVHLLGVLIIPVVIIVRCHCSQLSL